MSQSKGLLLAGVMFMLGGAIQLYTQGVIGAAFIAIGGMFVALSGKKKSEGDDNAR